VVILNTTLNPNQTRQMTVEVHQQTLITGITLNTPFVESAGVIFIIYPGSWAHGWSLIKPSSSATHGYLQTQTQTQSSTALVVTTE
jgi:hypothetical protein